MAFGWTTLDSFMQQDVQEMMRVLLDKLEEKMKDTEVKGVIKHLFSGTVKSFIRCVNVEYESSREEDFYDIQLDVKGCADIYESFKRYVSKEMLDGENKYDAEVHGKQDAEKGVIFTKLPPVLTIHLKRFDFDIQRMCFAKIHDKFVFPVELNLDEFLDPSSADGTKNEYLLHSVLVHSGDVHGGHYYAFIRPSESKFWSDGEGFANASGGQWFRFDDENVFKVPRQEAIDNCFGRDLNATTFRSFSSAYMLVYIRKGEATSIMKRVSSESVPLALIERLKSEQDNKKIEEHEKMITEHTTHVNYYLEEDVASFKSFNNKSRDSFLDSENPRKLSILKDWTFYGLYIEFAKLLKVPIYNLCLWMIEFNDFDIRVQCSHWDWLQSNRCSLDFGDNRGKYAFYVQVADPSEIDQLQLSKIGKLYDDLLDEERRWLNNIRTTLDPDSNFQFDVAEGLGVGKSTLTLKKRSPSNDIYSKFIVHLESIKDRFSHHLSQIVKYHGQNRRLCFIRIFDPDQRLDPSNFHIEHENCPFIYRYIGQITLSIFDFNQLRVILPKKIEALCKQPELFELYLKSSILQIHQDSHGKVSQLSIDEDTSKSCALICVELPSTKISFESWFRNESLKKQFVLAPLDESHARVVFNVSGNSETNTVVDVSVEFSLLDVFITVSKSLGIHYSYLKLGLSRSLDFFGKEIKPVSGQQLQSVQLKGDVRGYNYISYAVYPVRVHDEINGGRVAGYFVEVNILDQRLRSKHTNSIEGTHTLGGKRRNDSVLPTTKHQKLDEDQLDNIFQNDYESSVCRDMEPHFKDSSKLYLQVVNILLSIIFTFVYFILSSNLLFLYYFRMINVLCLA
jgi:mRNA-degrading endonuclease HigB of HigAB toxin-antitoxin module